ncbi:hypothetical protein AB0J35_57785 [Nonomuraea angiospora]|uniref:hypothetical protein n=1 Tax=Nonomuraea angiospora TaxID=46172 RepID=UPI003419DA65
MSDAQYVEDIDEFLDGYHLPEDEVPICMRTDLQRRFEQLQRALEAARHAPGSDTLAGSGSEARRIAEEIQALREEMQSHVRVFVLKAIPRKSWRDLLRDHPPRPQDLPADHNVETFPVAALVACSVKPKLTEEKAGRLVDMITQGQWGALWGTILELNGDDGSVPFSDLASAILSRTSRS